MNNSITASTKQICLAHISDPHLTSLENTSWRELLNKRILGYLSWRSRRRYAHRMEILQKLQIDLFKQEPDHLIVSGDLTHIGTKNECIQAASWLDKLNTPEHVTVIPGNHDRYAPADWQDTLGRWQDYMVGDNNHPENGTEIIFPILRRRASLAIIGLSTALPTLPFLASGRLGQMQLKSLDKLLAELGEQDLFRVIVLHHGPVAGTTNRRRGLDDAEQFRAVLRKRGAELVLHGHGHKFFHGKIASKSGFIPVFGVPSASAMTDNPEKRAGYNTYEIENFENHWCLKAYPHVLNEEASIFSKLKEYTFELSKH